MSNEILHAEKVEENRTGWHCTWVTCRFLGKKPEFPTEKPAVTIEAVLYSVMHCNTTH